MGGNASNLKKHKEQMVHHDVANISSSGQPIHPLLIPHVADNIFSNLGGRDLLSMRRVCVEWHTLATEVYRSRKDIVKTVTLNNRFIKRFIDLMTLSQVVPVVRWFIDEVYHSQISTASFLQFLTFMAPSVRSLKVVFLSYPPRGLGVENLAAALLSKLDPHALSMPELDMLDISEYGDHSYLPDDVGPLTLRIVERAEGLQTFCVDLLQWRTSRAVILPALPMGLRRLDFGSRYQGPYSLLLESSRFHLKELKDDADTHCYTFNGEALVDFLSAHRDSLVRVDVAKLETIYEETYPRFPQLKFVQKLGCHVNWNSTFEFLTSFPNVVELSIHPKKWFGRLKDVNCNYLRQHHSVRKLHINLAGMVNDGFINFLVLGHCFPDVTHLSTPIGGVGEGLTDIFTNFPNIQWLYLHFNDNQMTPRGWQPLWSGISRELCDTMDETGSYEDTPGDEVGQGIGLTNLKRLQTLEVNALGMQDSRVDGMRFMFTSLTFHRVFARMDSLKEICFERELGIPQACLPFVEPLRAKGIDLYVMKRRADWLQH